MRDSEVPVGTATVLTGEPSDRLKKVAAIAAVAVAAVLICAKAVAYFATGSVSLLSTLVDSLLDLAASIINLIAIRHAAQPADREHRFGHGKAEPLAGLGQSTFIAGSAVFLLVQAGERLVQRQPISNEAIGIGVMVLSIVLTLGLVLFQRRVIRTTGSLAIGADALHYQIGSAGQPRGHRRSAAVDAARLETCRSAVRHRCRRLHTLQRLANLLRKLSPAHGPGVAGCGSREDQEHRLGAPVGVQYPRSAHPILRHASVHSVPSRA